MNGRAEIRLHILGRACHLVVDHSPQQNQELLDQALAELRRLEQKFSPALDGSIIRQINQAAGSDTLVPLDAESLSLFNYAQALWQQSHHLFDPSAAALAHCWNDNGTLKDALDAKLALVGWGRLERHAEGVRLPTAGMALDLGPCVRPYAVDSARKLLARAEVSSALIDLDYDVATLGKQGDGSNWLVGHRYPQGTRTVITRLKLNGSGYSLRGDFERRLRCEGENFGRAFSPIDGYPIPGLLSVAVIADSCLEACGAGIVAQYLSEAAGLQWLQTLGLPWFAIDRELSCHGPLSKA